MQVSDQRRTVEVKDASAQHELPERFVPKGAIAFFILLVILGLIIWFGIYFLMLDRI